MAANNINDISTFQTVDNISIEAQSIPVQNYVSETISQSTSAPVENVTTVTPSTTSTGMSLHSILMSNSNTTSTVPSPAPTPSVNQNQVPQTTAGQTNTKPALPVTSNQTNTVAPDQILTKTRLQDLVKEIDPCEQLDEEVEDLLLQLVDDFVNSTVNTACVFAKHRNANTVEVKDVQLYLEKTYNMWIPGFGTEEVKPYKKPPMTEAHKQRLALIRKSLKKY